MDILLQIILITSIWVLGYTVGSQEGMLLYPIREWATKIKEKGNKWMDTLFVCHICMPSTHSLIGFVAAYCIGVIHGFEWRFVVMYPLVVCGSAMLNAIVWSFYQSISQRAEYYKNVNDNFNQPSHDD